MAENKSLTVRYLKELAQKHLGKGHSRLKTKDQLLSALREVPGLVRTLLGHESTQGEPVKEAAAAKSGTGVGSPVPTGSQEPAGAPLKAAVPPAAVSPAKSEPAPLPNASSEKPAKAKEGSTEEAAMGPADAQTTALGASSGAAIAEPVIEGFFVARVAGEEEARRHHLTREHDVPRGPPVYDERLGELPDSYPEDELVALPRDPKTLFLFWGVTPQSRTEAAAGLHEPRTVLRLFEGGKLVREQEFALESRSYYLQGLEPGHRYRAEIHFVGADGSSRRVGKSSNSVALPSLGVSSDETVRFLRVPWDAALAKLKELTRAGGNAVLRQETGVRRYLEWVWNRVQLPGSAGFRDEARPVERIEQDRSNPPASNTEATYLPTPSGLGVSSPSSHTWLGSGSGSGSGRS